ncbi:MAG: L-rhamnose mutarotase [Eubacteriales bacterium]|nr:L-rhamnose mutarotase [Eubacteriales bacterium]
MKMFVYLLDLKDDKEKMRCYLKRHKEVEPAVPQKLKELGVLHSRVCRLGTRLVNVLITEDSFRPEDIAKYTDNATCKKWDDEMMTYQQKAPCAAEGEWWALTETVFMCDTIGIGS